MALPLQSIFFTAAISVSLRILLSSVSKRFHDIAEVLVGEIERINGNAIDDLNKSSCDDITIGFAHLFSPGCDVRRFRQRERIPVMRLYTIYGVIYPCTLRVTSKCNGLRIIEAAAVS